MSQQADEQIRAFVARLTATADMCGMSVSCACGNQVIYRDNVLLQLVIHGMRDNDVRIRVLSRNTNGELVTLDKLVDYIQAEEAGKNESSDLMTEDYHVNGIRKKSTFQKDKHRCSHCGQQRHTQQNTPEDRKNMCKAFGAICNKCQKKNHLPSVCRASKSRVSTVMTSNLTNQQSPSRSHEEVEVSSIASFFAIETPKDDLPYNGLPTSVEDLTSLVSHLRQAQDGPVTTLPLPHYVHDVVAGWNMDKPKPSPSLSVQFTLDRQAYGELSLPVPRLSAGAHPGRSDMVPSVCDTGAQLTVVPHSLLRDMHVKLETIFPIQTKIHGVSNSPLLVDGGILLTISAKHPTSGTLWKSRQLAYVSSHISTPYLSFQACTDLGLISPNFP